MELMLPTEPARIATKMAYRMNVDTLQVNQTVTRMESRTSANSIATSMECQTLARRLSIAILMGYWILANCWREPTPIVTSTASPTLAKSPRESPLIVTETEF